jgi:hypothetical protein
MGAFGVIQLEGVRDGVEDFLRGPARYPRSRRT